MPDPTAHSTDAMEELQRWRFLGISPTDLFENTNNQPLLVHAESEDAERAEWVLKPFARLGGPCSINELVGSRFARWLGVPVPDFGVIDVDPEVVSALKAPLAERIANSTGPNFGSRFISGFMELERSGSVATNARGTACDIFCLDVLVDNADRNVGRSNVLVGNGALRAIDHEHMFSYFGLIGGGGPAWKTDTFHRLSPRTLLCRAFPRLARRSKPPNDPPRPA